jgi:hypothetical protein
VIVPVFVLIHTQQYIINKKGKPRRDKSTKLFKHDNQIILTIKPFALD